MRTAIFISFIYLLQSCNNSSNAQGKMKTTAGLPVKVLHADYKFQNHQRANNFNYPAYDTISDSAEFKDQIAAYGAAGLVWIGPKGWTGEGSLDSNGTLYVKLRPAVRQDSLCPNIVFSEISAPQEFVIRAATRYFGAVYRKYNMKFPKAENKPDITPEGDTIQRMEPMLCNDGLSIDSVLCPTLVIYTYHAVRFGYGFFKGLAYFSADEGKERYCFKTVEFEYAESDSKLVDFLICTYIKERGLK